MPEVFFLFTQKPFVLWQSASAGLARRDTPSPLPRAERRAAPIHSRLLSLKALDKHALPSSRSLGPGTRKALASHW
jgi:hypothetical protein